MFGRRAPIGGARIDVTGTRASMNARWADNRAIRNGFEAGSAIDVVAMRRRPRPRRVGGSIRDQAFRAVVRSMRDSSRPTRRSPSSLILGPPRKGVGLRSRAICSILFLGPQQAETAPRRVGRDSVPPDPGTAGAQTENTMLFRQLFHSESSTYTYLLAGRPGGEAILIDPVLSEAQKYAQLLRELDLKLVLAMDTHVHADHITALGSLRDTTGCTTVMGEQSRAECVSVRVRDGEVIRADGVELTARYTPGHTDDSYSFMMDDAVFTGDTLLIRGTGRTDFQNGDPSQQYDSLFGILLRLPDETKVFPAHDYKGWMMSTIGEERAYNPRLQVSSREAYVEQMNNLRLPNPKLMDIAVRANLQCGMTNPAKGP